MHVINNNLLYQVTLFFDGCQLWHAYVSGGPAGNGGINFDAMHEDENDRLGTQGEG